MRELLLVSNGLGALADFIGEPRASIVFIPTAVNLDDDTWYVDEDRDYLRGLGYELTEFDLEGKGESEVTATLGEADVVYLAGGNTFYLLEKVLQSGLDKVLLDFLDHGGKYVGASAGAIIVGPSLEPFQSFDDPSVANLSSFAGLGLVDFVPLPHFTEDNTAYRQVIDTYEKKYRLVPLTDNQAIRVTGADYQVVESPT